MEIISQIKRKDEEVDEDKNDFFDNLKENSPKYDEK